jgi:hypothetical protein
LLYHNHDLLLVFTLRVISIYHQTYESQREVFVSSYPYIFFRAR